MKNKSVTIPLIPIIILVSIIAIIVICMNGVKNKDNDEKNLEIKNQKSSVTFKVSNITAKAGEEITINVKMNEDSNFVAANFELLYDNSQMQFLKYEKGEILENGAMAIVNNDESQNKILIGYVGDPKNETNIVEKGELISITFKVNEDINDSQINPEFKCTTLKEKNGTDIINVINQGVITIK